MPPLVVDTNVLVAANGRQTHADVRCRTACIDSLVEVCEAGQLVAIDDGGAIVEEYARHANWAGSPGVGDVFFKHVWNHQYDAARVVRARVTPTKDEDRGFEELPANSFDPSDRKFLAVAVVEKAVVLNATDSDWDEQLDLMRRLAVEVRQLCPQHAT